MSVAKVFIHSSQFPNKVMQDYVDSFQTRVINHKFHYDSIKQSQKWLALHNAYCPAREADGYIDTYHHCFHRLLTLIPTKSIDLISLGCGGGEKELSLLNTIDNKPVSASVQQYFPIDVSVALALIATDVAHDSHKDLKIQPFVCDLSVAGDLLEHLDRKGNIRVLTFFGMIPNFKPGEILPILSTLLDCGDYLLFSANLAPGDQYEQGVNTVLAQYDNAMTKDWLQTALLDAGVNMDSGTLVTKIKTDDHPLALKRIAIDFAVHKAIEFNIYNEKIHWDAGDIIQLFFSYRYTSNLLANLLHDYGIEIIDAWESIDQQEGVYLCRKAGHDLGP